MTSEPTLVPDAAGTPRERLEAVLYELRRVVVGQDRLLDRVLVALLSRGHILLEGVPGLAKTLTLETTARIAGGRFSRIQFTPDLVPSDVVGGQILEDGRLATRLGPVFANFVLADEINRAPAKVQSALLEVMAEGHATIAGETHPTPRPFFVLATQNPIESEGDYAQPEAQVDRFAMKLVVGYPSQADEEEIVRRMASDPPQPRQLLDPGQILELQAAADAVFVDHRVRAYAVRLVTATREPGSEGLDRLAPYLDLGGSPRASLALVRGARALAVMRGRTYAGPEDVHDLFHDVLRHRVVLSYEALAAEVRPDQVLDAILEAIPQPDVEMGSGRSVA
ncbi:MAG: MoxR-like ATPase [Miltoncostaeaceae bacterium]|nr:MoxR-like ATPase [Miltoncostaeaceae bacterium]